MADTAPAPKSSTQQTDWEDMFENPNIGFLTQLGHAETSADLRRGMVMVLNSIYTRKSDEEELAQHIKSLESVLPDGLSDAQLAQRRRACIRILRTIKKRMIADAAAALPPDEAAPVPVPPRRRKGERTASSPSTPTKSASGVSKSMIGFVIGFLVIAASVAGFIATRGDVHPAKQLIKQMTELHETTDFRGGTGKHLFGGTLQVTTKFDRRAVIATNVPPEVCAGAAWSLANKGTIEINGVLPNHIRTHELKAQCEARGPGAELVWFPKED